MLVSGHGVYSILSMVRYYSVVYKQPISFLYNSSRRATRHPQSLSKDYKAPPTHLLGASSGLYKSATGFWKINTFYNWNIIRHLVQTSTQLYVH